MNRDKWLIEDYMRHYDISFAEAIDIRIKEVQDTWIKELKQGGLNGQVEQ